LHVAVQEPFAVVGHETDIHAPGMQVDTAGKWGLLGVESPEVSSS
jgi:septin family protein